MLKQLTGGGQGRDGLPKGTGDGRQRGMAWRLRSVFQPDQGDPAAARGPGQLPPGEPGRLPETAYALPQGPSSLLGHRRCRRPAGAVAAVAGEVPGKLNPLAGGRGRNNLAGVG